MTTANSHGSETPRCSIPLRIVTRQPAFNDPWLSPGNISRQTFEGTYAILDVEDGPNGNGADLPVPRVRVVNGFASVFLCDCRIHPSETLDVILAEHDTSQVQERAAKGELHRPMVSQNFSKRTCFEAAPDT